MRWVPARTDLARALVYTARGKRARHELLERSRKRGSRGCGVCQAATRPPGVAHSMHLSAGPSSPAAAPLVAPMRAHARPCSAAPATAPAPCCGAVCVELRLSLDAKAPSSPDTNRSRPCTHAPRPIQTLRPRRVYPRAGCARARLRPIGASRSRSEDRVLTGLLLCVCCDTRCQARARRMQSMRAACQGHAAGSVNAQSKYGGRGLQAVAVRGAPPSRREGRGEREWG